MLDVLLGLGVGSRVSVGIFKEKLRVEVSGCLRLAAGSFRMSFCFVISFMLLIFLLIC